VDAIAFVQIIGQDLLAASRENTIQLLAHTTPVSLHISHSKPYTGHVTEMTLGCVFPNEGLPPKRKKEVASKQTEP